MGFCKNLDILYVVASIGSIPTFLIAYLDYYLGRYTVSGSGADCKSAGLCLSGFNSLPAHCESRLEELDLTVGETTKWRVVIIGSRPALNPGGCNSLESSSLSLSVSWLV